MQARVLDSAAVAELLRGLAAGIEENDPVAIPARHVPSIIRDVLRDILRENTEPHAEKPPSLTPGNALRKPLAGNPRMACEISADDVLRCRRS